MKNNKKYNAHIYVNISYGFWKKFKNISEIQNYDQKLNTGDWDDPFVDRVRCYKNGKRIELERREFKNL